jgi:uracil-DNA glycosylase
MLQNAQTELDQFQAELRQCRKCGQAGYFIGSRPIFSGPASAQVMIVGQAPAKVEAGEKGQPFGRRQGGQRSLLWAWLEQAGWPEAEFRANHYLSAMTKCYPGKSKNGRGDRLPSAAERELCRPWRELELALIQPKVIIPIGRVAIEWFLPGLKSQPLENFIGQVFEWGEAGQAALCPTAKIVPLPHPSGVSRWLNSPQNQALVNKALAQLKVLKQKLNIQ